MEMEILTFTNSSNARRKAKKMIEDGTAPGTAFDIVAADGRFTIVWPQPEPEPPAPPKWTVGSRVVLSGVIVQVVGDEGCWVALDGAADDDNIRLGVGELAVAKIRGTRRERSTTPRTGESRRTKNTELDEAAARGEMPAKPDVTSHANHHYQKRFDRLAELAAADDWDAVAVYECTGVNSYAKMVRQYRDRLLAAHRANSP